MLFLINKIINHFCDRSDRLWIIKDLRSKLTQFIVF